MILLATYSFLDTRCSITGPGGNFQLGQDAGIADEGISFERTEDQGAMTIGASGDGMHTLFAGKSGRVTIRLLKTSPVNAMLQRMFDVQAGSSRNWGKNTIVCNTPTGDIVTASQAAFQRQPNNGYAKNAALMEWSFNAIRLDQVLGDNV